jgi:putative ABC transport system permease protein
MSAFDLERAIAEWRKELRRNPALEDGQAAELEACLRDEIEELIGKGIDPEAAFRQAVAAMGPAADAGGEFYKAKRTRRSARPPWQAPRFVPGLAWNYVQVAMRRARRQRAYTFINIFGLALGVAAGLLVLAFVRDELGYDRFHAKADRIYRLAQNIHVENRIDSALPTPPILAAALAEEFPEIEATARVARMGGIVRIGDQRFFSNRVYAADPDFFEVFSFPLANGDPQTALAEPNRVILTRSAAGRCFGDGDAMGRVLSIGGTDFIVTGIAENCPRNSHFHFEFLTSIPTYPRSKRTGWFEGFCATYVVLRPGVPPGSLEAKLPDFVLRRHYGGNKGNGFFKDWVYFLQPLTSIHLRSHLLIGEFEANGSAAYVRIFLFIAIFVLVVACVNYVNLATARSAVRGREVGVRKVFGSRRPQLIRQFLAESVLTALAAFAVAAAIVAALLPAFRDLTGKDIGAGELFEPRTLLFVLLLVVIVGVGSGIYPALVLSSFRPAAVLGGTRSAGPGFGSAALRKGLIVLQFAISTFLLVGTAVVYSQTDYFLSKRLGFDREHVLVVRDAQLLGKDVRAFKDRLLQVPGIERVSLASALPGSGLDTRSLEAVLPEGSRDDIVVEMITCDEDLPAALGLDMAAGRFFSPGRPADERALVINETAARDLGWPQPIGKTIKHEKEDFAVIGVVRDFHFHSLHAKIPRTVLDFTGRIPGPERELLRRPPPAGRSPRGRRPSPGGLGLVLPASPLGLFLPGPGLRRALHGRNSGHEGPRRLLRPGRGRLLFGALRTGLLHDREAQAGDRDTQGPGRPFGRDRGAPRQGIPALGPSRQPGRLAGRVLRHPALAGWVRLPRRHRRLAVPPVGRGGPRHRRGRPRLPDPCGGPGQPGRLPALRIDRHFRSRRLTTTG